MFLGEDEFAFLKSIPCFDGFFVGEFYLVLDCEFVFGDSLSDSVYFVWF